MAVYGLKVALLGMGTVFISLCLIMFLIQLQSYILAPKPTKEKEKVKKEKAIEPKIMEARVLETEDDSHEIAAVIAAAIAACDNKVVVKTIRRVCGSSGSMWSNASKSEAMVLRQI